MNVSILLQFLISKKWFEHRLNDYDQIRIGCGDFLPRHRRPAQAFFHSNMIQNIFGSRKLKDRLNCATAGTDKGFTTVRDAIQP
jgi:hypothetical protein